MKKLLLILIFLASSFLNVDAQILTLESKTNVTLNVVSLRTGKVKMLVDTEERNSLAITVNGRYVESETGDLIKPFTYTVPNTIANQLGAVPIPNGASLIEARNVQLMAGVFSILGQHQDFGLSANQWEIVE